MSNILDSRNWRYATKKFDSSKKVSDEDLNTFLEAVQLSASSFGLQPYHIYVITDQAVKEKLRPASWDQSQITDASHVIVFANYADFDDALVDEYMNTMVETRGVPAEAVKGYGDFMKSKLGPLPAEVKSIWTTKQVYIALGNALQAAAELQIDSTPMEGFDAEQYNKILNLPKNQNTAVVLTLGYRSEEDETQHYAKVRKSKETLFTHI